MSAPLQLSAVEPLLLSLYAAATGQARWEQPLQQVCQFCEATAVRLGVLNAEAGWLMGLGARTLGAPETAGAAAFGLAPDFVFRSIDAAAANGQQTSSARAGWAGTATAAPQACSGNAGDWSHSESRAAWPAELTSRPMLAAGLAMADSQRWHLCWATQGPVLHWLALALPGRRRQLRVDELSALERLAWHLPLALRLHLQIRAHLAPAPLGPVLLERMHHPAWLVDGSGRLLLANAEARNEMLGKQRLVQDGEALRQPRQALHKQLTQQLALLAQSRHGSRAWLPLGPAEVQRSWLCLQSLHAGGVSAPAGLGTAAEGCAQGSTWRALPAASPPPCLVLVSLFEPGRDFLLEAGILARAFELTPAQARVAVLLAQGHTAAQVAVLLGLQESTVRTHQRQVLRKLGLQRKIDLVRMLGLSGWLWRQLNIP